MSETVITVIWNAATILCLLSGLVFILVKKPEYTWNRLMQNSTGYWFKNLDQVVPKKWVKPIHYLAFIGAFLFMISALYLVLGIL